MHGASKKQRLSAVVLCWGQCLDDWLKRIASRLEAIASRLEAIAGGLKGIAKQAVIFANPPKSETNTHVCCLLWARALDGSIPGELVGSPRRGAQRR